MESFLAIQKKDPDSFLFALTICGDRAAAVGMTILASVLNVGEKLPSSNEQFLLFRGNVDISKSSDICLKSIYFCLILFNTSSFISTAFSVIIHPSDGVTSFNT